MNNQKGFVPVLIVILIAVLVGGYFVYTNSQTKTPAPTPQPTTYSTPQPSPSPADASPVPNGTGETASTEQSRSANWKTYTDAEGGFSLQYPENWTTKKIVRFLHLTPKELTNKSIIEIEILNNPSELSLQDYAIRNEPSKTADDPGITYKNAQLLSDTSGVKKYYTEQYACQPVFCQAYILLYKKSIIILKSYPVSVAGIIPNQKEIFDQILFTFRFTQ